MTVDRDLVVVTDDAHRRHDPPYELNAGQRVSPVHERPARLEAIEAAVRAAGLETRPALPHDDQHITAVHDPDMVAFLRDGHAAWRAAGGPDVLIPDTFPSPRWARGGRPTASPFGRAGWYVTDTATPIVAGSWAAARAGVDVACTAVDAVLDGHRAAYAMIRPPGHHAGPDYLGGFCLLNNAAIAAMRLRSEGRVAIVDVDVHHGNGTQDVFWTDPQVLYVSVHTDPDHQYPFFSGTAGELGADAGHGTTRNLPLPPGTGDAAFLHAVEVAGELVAAFDPATVVVSLGLDAAAADPIGQLALSDDGFRRLGVLLAALDRPTVLVQEGGYALDRLGTLAVGVLAAFRSQGAADEPNVAPTSGPRGAQGAVGGRADGGGPSETGRRITVRGPEDGTSATRPPGEQPSGAPAGPPARSDDARTENELLEQLADIARRLSEAENVDVLLQLVVDLGEDYLDGCDGASLMLIGQDRTISTPAYSSRVAYESDLAQYEADEGPCLDALRDHAVYLIDDLETEVRWPRYRARALELGVRSMLSYRLHAKGRTFGALDFYSKRPGVYSPFSQVIGQVFASHAGVALKGAFTEAGMERTIASRDIIGQAKGILMERRDLSAVDAFATLRALSRDNNIPVRDIAERIVTTGEIPT